MKNDTITHRCGHQEEHVLYGNREEVLQRKTALTGKTCSACRRQDRRRREDSAAAWAKTEGLPELVGERRQVLTGEVNRWETLTCAPLLKAAHTAAVVLRGPEADRAGLPGPVRRMLDHPAARDALRQVARYTEELIAEMREETSAAWWSAHRRNSAWYEVEAKIQQKTLALRSAFRGVA